jgi:hypothetical protein
MGPFQQARPAAARELRRRYREPMALMTGQGPFGHAPAGSFNRRLPGDGLLYLEPSPRRIRGLLGDEVVVDSTRVWLLLEHRRLPATTSRRPTSAAGCWWPTGAAPGRS